MKPYGNLLRIGTAGMLLAQAVSAFGQQPSVEAFARKVFEYNERTGIGCLQYNPDTKLRTALFVEDVGNESGKVDKYDFLVIRPALPGINIEMVYRAGTGEFLARRVYPQGFDKESETESADKLSANQKAKADKLLQDAMSSNNQSACINPLTQERNE